MKIKEETFKQWIKKHDPKMKWNWNDPVELKSQFIRVIRDSGDIDLDGIFHMMFANTSSGLTFEQTERFNIYEY